MLCANSQAISGQIPQLYLSCCITLSSKVSGCRERAWNLDTGWSGNFLSPQVTVLGTPAEEDGGGKIDMIRLGAFEGLDVVFMAHPSQEDAYYLPDVAEHE